LDEPYYPFYLLGNGFNHPFRDELMAHRCTDIKIINDLVRKEVDDDKTFILQKHIAKNIDLNSDLSWLRNAHHIFLIRKPEAIISSFLKATNSSELSLHDTGYSELYTIFKKVRSAGEPFVIVDMDMFFDDVPKSLKSLCHFMDIEYSDEILSWDSGLIKSNVLMGNVMSFYDSPFQFNLSTSTRFVKPDRRNNIIFESPSVLSILAECRALYDDLKKYIND
jgi:hypothetical protein